jgi:hypothetical protein
MNPTHTAVSLNPLKGFVAIACSLVLVTGAVNTASAEFIFKIPDTVVLSNGTSPTTGTLHGLLQLTGNDLSSPPNNVMSVNIAFQTGPTGQLAFSTPQEPSSQGLISGGNVFTGASDLANDIIRFADDAVNAVTAFNNARLVSVPFTINAGVNNAVFPVSLIQGNELGNSAAQAFPITLMGGNIIVRPIPEPHSIALALLASSLVCLRRRRR